MLTDFEPNGVSLKAAWLLLRELKRYPQLPSMEQLALILDRTLNYEWAVRIIRVAGTESPWNDPTDGAVAFKEWAENTLVGPDMRDQEEEGGGGESKVEMIGGQ